jgi:hypothetical protein
MVCALSLSCGCHRPAAGNDSTSPDGENAASATNTEVLSSIAEGETLAADYVNPPLYRGFRFAAYAAETVDLSVRSDDGDAVAWVLDDRFYVLAVGSDADATRSSHVIATVPWSGTFYIVFRERSLRAAHFTVRFTAASAPVVIDLAFMDLSFTNVDLSSTSSDLSFTTSPDAAPIPDLAVATNDDLSVKAPLDLSSASGAVDLAGLVCTGVGFRCGNTSYGCCPGTHCQPDGTCGCAGDPCTAAGYPSGCSCGGMVYSCIADPGAPNFHCSALPGIAGQLCKADNDCASYLKCLSGVCTDVPCSGTSCTAGYGSGGCCHHDPSCIGASGSTPKQCSSTCGGSGAGCASRFDCCSGMVCTGGVCTTSCAGMTCAGGLCCTDQPYCVGLAGATSTSCSAKCGQSGDLCNGSKDCCSGFDCTAGRCTQSDCAGWACGQAAGGRGCCGQAPYCTGALTTGLTCNYRCATSGVACWHDFDCCGTLHCVASPVDAGVFPGTCL